MKNHQTRHQLNTAGIAILGIPGLLIIITILCGVVLLPSSTHANTEQSNVSVIVNSSCSITTGGGNYAKVVSPGTAEEIVGNGINVTCNDSNGYALYTSGYSGDSYNTVDSTRMLAVAGSNYIPTGTNGSSSAYGSYWAMKAAGSSSLSPSTAPTIDNSFDNYHEVPSTYTKISHYTGSTLGTTSNSVTTPTYKVYVGTAQPASTYIGKVKYTLVHPNDAPAANYMQNWTGCSSMAIGSETFLIDSRDNKVYNITKFNDGKCWMTTNLDLAGGTALSANDTDVSSDYISSFTTSNNLTKDDVNNKIILPESSTVGFNQNDYSFVYNSGNASSTCSTPGCYSYYSWDAATLGSGRSIATGNTDAPYSICPKGWHLPSAKNDISDFRNLLATLNGYNNLDSYGANTNPTGTEMIEILFSAHFNPLPSGAYQNNSFDGRDARGIYWYSTVYGSNKAVMYFDFYLGNSPSMRTEMGGNRFLGFAIRCLTD